MVTLAVENHQCFSAPSIAVLVFTYISAGGSEMERLLEALADRAGVHLNCTQSMPVGTRRLRGGVAARQLVSSEDTQAATNDTSIAYLRLRGLPENFTCESALEVAAEVGLLAADACRMTELRSPLEASEGDSDTSPVIPPLMARPDEATAQASMSAFVVIIAVPSLLLALGCCFARMFVCQQGVARKAVAPDPTSAYRQDGHITKSTSGQLERAGVDVEAKGLDLPNAKSVSFWLPSGPDVQIGQAEEHVQAKGTSFWLPPSELDEAFALQTPAWVAPPPQPPSAARLLEPPPPPPPPPIAPPETDDEWQVCQPIVECYPAFSLGAVPEEEDGPSEQEEEEEPPAAPPGSPPLLLFCQLAAGPIEPDEIGPASPASPTSPASEEGESLEGAQASPSLRGTACASQWPGTPGELDLAGAPGM